MNRCRPVAFSLLVSLVVVVIVAACGERETLFKGEYDPQAMETAIATAKSEVDSFIAKFEAGDGEDFSVKAPVVEGEHVEHFWLSEITYANGVFEGTIGNEPGTVSNVVFGQKYSIAKEGISDWLYFKEGKMHGNHTLRVLLDSMPAAEAAEWRALLAK